MLWESTIFVCSSNAPFKKPFYLMRSIRTEVLCKMIIYPCFAKRIKKQNSKKFPKSSQTIFNNFRSQVISSWGISQNQMIFFWLISCLTQMPIWSHRDDIRFGLFSNWQQSLPQCHDPCVHFRLKTEFWPSFKALKSAL